MLVLTRKVDDRIQIGENIVVTVVRINEDTVRIGVEAPLTAPIVRGERQWDEQDQGRPQTKEKNVGKKH